MFNIKKRIKNRLRKFFASRAPRQDEIKLTLKNVYVFFSKEGLLFGLLLLITFIAGVNYGNNLVLGLCFYLASLWLISLHITFSHVAGLKIRLLETNMTEAGQPAWVTLQIINEASQASRQLTLEFDVVEDEKQSSKSNQQNETSDDDRVVTVSQVDKQQVVKLPILTSRRGQLILPRLKISTVYPLGVMRAWAYAYFVTPVWVYPKPLSVEWQTKKAQAIKEEAKQSYAQKKGQNDFDMLDEYQEGESLARVSWAHVASGHGMLTKHFADSVGQRLSVDYNDMPAMNHEGKLRQMVYVIKELEQTNHIFNVVLPSGQSEFGQGKAFIDENLLRLAKTP